MKITTIFLVLLLSFGLSSCSNTLQEKIITEEPSDTETISDEINTGKTTDAEPVSIVFMGETIMAPGHYPGVPDLYIPVLDDLYLYGALLQRYSFLHYDGKVTQEIMRECERVQAEVRQRGYLPYPGDGLGITGGYALVDLDGDGGSELLILNNSPYYIQVPVISIKSIFAIRNGRLVCIDNGSLELNYTILTIDGTFYQYIDWQGAGYANLRAFRLETGMSEFTTILEAHAALSFSDRDVPVPYWVKIENGYEINITEDEFYALLEPYENPKKLKVMDFVPLHPDEIDPWSVPRPTDASTTMPNEYPVAYHGAPEAYKPILDALFLLDMRWDEYGSGEDLERVGFVEYPHPRDSALGYALVDLNNDGVFELLLGSIDGLNASSPNSIFTLKNGQPVLVTSFWSRSHGVVSVDGTIYSMGSGGASYTYLSSFKLDKNAYTLTQLTDMRSDYSFSEEKPYFIQVIEGRNHYISEQEFFDFCKMYDDPPERMKLTFISIAS